VTEAEWLACTDPEPMLEFLRGTASDRKLRLFCVGCCRTLWPTQLSDPPFPAALAVAELFADGLVEWADVARDRGFSDPHLRDLLDRLDAAGPADPGEGLVMRAAYAAAWAASDDAALAARIVAGTGVGAECPIQAGLLRCLFGAPFRPVACSSSWRTDTAGALARQMYEARDFSALPILADALQDAGCDSEEILGHCRDTSLAHIRGCWCVDLVLGKE
jgi:hypothetical protein